MTLRNAAALAALLLLLTNTTANAQMRITEWMYSSNLGGDEWIEFTNVGTTAIDMSGWSYDDSSELAGTFLLDSLGVVAPGDSVIITEGDATTFRSAWSLPASVAVLGGYTNNLGRSDEINLFDGLTLVDRLTFGDQDFSGSVRAQDITGNPLTPAALGANDVYQWAGAYVGDPWGSYFSSYGALGNPGTYVVPEPSTVVLLVLGCVALVGRRMKSAVRTGRAS